jgi:NAD(P) transhydrogenase
VIHKISKDQGYTDLPSRLPTQSSTLYSNNITKFLLSIGENNAFNIDLTDEVVRGSIVVHQGAILPPAPRPTPPPAARPTPKVEEKVETLAITPWQKATREIATVTAGMGSAVALGKMTGAAFMSNFFTFGLAGLVGYRVVWGVAPALHSPLMSVTNAISGIYLFFGYEIELRFSKAWLVLAVCSSWEEDIFQKLFLRYWAHSPCSLLVSM